MFVSLVLRNYGKTKNKVGSRGYLIETEKMGFVEPEEDKNQETLLLLWCGDEGACWHKNTRNRLWICIVIIICIVLFQALFFLAVSYALNIV